MNTKSPECWASDPQARALRIEISPEQSLLLPYDQFAFAELTTEKNEQHLRLVFASHEIMVRGHALRRIETAPQRMELSWLAKVSANHKSLIGEGQPAVLDVVVTQAKAERDLPDSG
ncbi:MAG: hypothetical protein HY735_19890 [Verrucomicrobia bacterium]|nr:hypothetical protein [Verrucomicrobiota bacterium]